MRTAHHMYLYESVRGVADNLCAWFFFSQEEKSIWFVYNGNKTLVESIQLGNILDNNLSFLFPLPQVIGLSVVLEVGMGGEVIP